jgi:tetratricopeptide (TPR) repeat protein
VQSQVLLARYLRYGYKAEAIALLERASEADPADFWIHFELGAENLDLQRNEAAVRHCTAARALRPKSIITWNNLGIALSNQRKMDQSIACFHKAIELNSKHAGTYINLGSNLHSQSKLNDALACYHRAIELDPMIAVAHNNLGACLFDQKKFEDAIPCLQRAIKLDPKLPVAHRNLGLALCALGEQDKGIICLSEAIALDPKYADPHHDLGNVQRDKGHVKEAIDEYREAIRLNKEFAEAPAKLALLARVQESLGSLYGEIGSTEQAEATLKEAVKTAETLVHDHPEETEYRRLLATVCSRLGKFYLHSVWQPEKAEPVILRALRIMEKLAEEHPNEVHYIFLVGWSYRQLGTAALIGGRLDIALTRYDTAMQWLERAANKGHGEARANLPTIRLLRAIVLAHRGEYLKAVEEAETVVREGSSDFDNACCVLCLASDAAAGDAKLSQPDRARLKAQYADRAMEFLRQAVAGGLRNVAWLRSDKDLTCLRSRADFQKLVQELELKTKQVDNGKK